MGLKRIDITSKQFVGTSGKVYHIDYDISHNRKLAADIVGLNLGYENGWVDVFKSDNAIFNMCTTGTDPINQLAQIAAFCGERMARVSTRVQTNFTDFARLCTIITYTEGEDRSKWDDDLAKEKIADWGEYNEEDFFHLAAIGFPGLADLAKHWLLAAHWVKQMYTAITALTSPTMKSTLETMSAKSMTESDLLESSWNDMIGG
jgi:hypothetical protein